MDVGHPTDYLDHRQYDKCDQHHKRDEYRGQDWRGVVALWRLSVLVFE